MLNGRAVLSNFCQGSEFREAHSAFATINFQYLAYTYAQNENEQLCFVQNVINIIHYFAHYI